MLDASALIKALTGEPGAEVALERLARETERVAPDWIRLEIASALTKKALRGELSHTDALTRMRVAPAYLTEEFATLDLLDDAVALSWRLSHAVYDCVYLALAERIGCSLVTADVRFAHRAQAAGYARVEAC